VRYSSNDYRQASESTDVASEPTSEPVISFVEHAGKRLVLSRYGDPIWDFTPYSRAANAGRSLLIRWSKCPSGFVPAIKSILHRYWMTGRPGGIRPTVTTIVIHFYAIARFLQWVKNLGAQRLADISPFHCTGWVHHCRECNLKPRSQ
jgi:hypothetical protein